MKQVLVVAVVAVVVLSLSVGYGVSQHRSFLQKQEAEKALALENADYLGGVIVEILMAAGEIDVDLTSSDFQAGRSVGVDLVAQARRDGKSGMDIMKHLQGFELQDLLDLKTKP